VLFEKVLNSPVHVSPRVAPLYGNAVCLILIISTCFILKPHDIASLIALLYNFNPYLHWQNGYMKFVEEIELWLTMVLEN